MKKLILISLITSCLTGLSAFGQGYFAFQTGKSQVWDCFSSGSPRLSTNVNVAFLWAANGAVPTISSLLTSTPPSSTPPGIWPPDAWIAILTDPNFTFAVNNANNQVAVARSAANGSLIYNGGTAFGVTGTSPDVTYTLFMIGWPADYATPALAAERTYVGWSAPFNYKSCLLTEVPSTMAGLTPQFGVPSVPEPSTVALAGFASLSLLFLRRRK